MLQLWKHPNGVWYVLYGPRLKRRVSTGTKNKAEAHTFAVRFAAGQQEPALDSPTVGQILESYRDDYGKDLRGQDGLRYGVKALIAGLGELLPEHLTPTVIKRYALQRGASNGTILREVGILRAALAWAKAHKAIAELPKISNPVKAPPGRRRWITKDEAQSLLQSAREPHIRLFIILGLTTAARMGAILEARWSQVDWKNRTINYGEGHGNKNRAEVPLGPDAMKVLRHAHETACSDHIIEYHGKPVRAIKKGFKLASDRAGLKDVTPHILRHTAASWMIQEGVPLAKVARMLGDSERTVERVYAKWTPGYLEEAARALQLCPKGRKAPYR